MHIKIRHKYIALKRIHLNRITFLEYICFAVVGLTLGGGVKEEGREG